jgi:hypothetical protein
MTPPDRSTLRTVPLSDLPLTGPRFPGQEMLMVTISAWQPMAAVHRAAYDTGCYLLELGDDEEPVRAYHRGVPH